MQIRRAPFFALLFLMLGIQTARADELPLAEDEDDTLSSAFGFYFQNDGPDHKGGNPKLSEDEFVFEGIVMLDKTIAQRDRLNVKVMGDIISSASQTRLHNPQFRALQSKPSGNKRISLDVGHAHEFDNFKLASHLGGSFEANEYGSILYGMKVAFPLAQNNTILSFGIDADTDIFQVKLFDGTEPRISFRQSLSFNPQLLQVITPTDIVNLSADYTFQVGTLETTYYSVYLNGVEKAEKMPDKRHRGALSARWKHSLGEYTTTELGYRIYLDSWSILSNTIEARFYQYLFSKHFLMEPSAYFYTQKGAYFFRREFSDLPQFRTSDTDLGPFTGVILGLKLSAIKLNFMPDWFDSISIGGNYWLRDDGFRIFWFDLGLSSRF